jgi:hypothetical protein
MPTFAGGIDALALASGFMLGVFLAFTIWLAAAGLRIVRRLVDAE